MANVKLGNDVINDINTIQTQNADDPNNPLLFSLEGGYTLPVASPTELGGVKPDAKTDAENTPVAVDADGKLWSKDAAVETIKLGDTEAVPVDKTVTIPAANTDDLGLVKLSDEMELNSTNQLSVKTLNVNKLSQTDGEVFEINGGSADTTF